MFKKKKKKEDPGWMMTFSDMMTLLLVFFVLLYSFSVVDIVKFQRFLASFQGVGILERGPEAMEQDKEKDFEIPLEAEADLSNSEALYETYLIVEEYIRENNMEMEVSVRLDERGVVLEIKDEILFASGQADLKPDALVVLQSLSGLLRYIPNTISVEGHTDNRPIHNARFPSNWELSTARALAVVRYLSENLGLSPDRFCAVGYGEYRPVAKNDSAENMARNRRVNIVINAENPPSLEKEEKT
ncbi:MAG: OmpA family protein [Syntrophomonadaceae bacterium]|jgi:chemotaxis protein MotB